MTATKRRQVARLKRLWKRHDQLERAILLLERRFTDKELKKLGSAAGG